MELLPTNPTANIQLTRLQELMNNGDITPDEYASMADEIERSLLATARDTQKVDEVAPAVVDGGDFIQIACMYIV